MANQVTAQMARELKKASVSNDAPIWAKLAEYATKPSVARRDVNLGRIGQLTREDDTVAFPGKVLGTGDIPHKITLFSFSVSKSAAQKVVDRGGRLISHQELVRENPPGRGIVLLG